MSRITSIDTRHYRIPLPVVLSDSTHGDISHSGLIVARVRDADGAEGVGYTYTVNDIGSRAIHALDRARLRRPRRTPRVMFPEVGQEVLPSSPASVPSIARVSSSMRLAM